MLAIGSRRWAPCDARISPFDALSTTNALASGFGAAACALPQKTNAAATTSVSRRIPERRLLHAQSLSDLERVRADTGVETLELRDGDTRLRRDPAERIAGLNGVELRAGR